MYLGGFGAAPRDLAHYPFDSYRQDLSENTWIWRIYLDEGAKIDTEMLAGVRNTIDVLLALHCIFQTSQNMQTDYNQASTPLSANPQLLLRMGRTARGPRAWLSFITVIIAALVKQSLHSYVAIVSNNSPSCQNPPHAVRWASDVAVAHDYRFPPSTSPYVLSTLLFRPFYILVLLRNQSGMARVHHPRNGLRSLCGCSDYPSYPPLLPS
ncbi:hypothetical protein ARMSODRAFT_125853 [Armillaria solidipes]|uniref:Uncharacterized protein n=1 Tax=Armillaria solidipes TaxID=1076256 RepID=A0A2H3BGY9_9AGAR|nr:hypothetical protein ARMSODRAFT_125853 [Armillaria solidipes]